MDNISRRDFAKIISVSGLLIAGASPRRADAHKEPPFKFVVGQVVAVTEDAVYVVDKKGPIILHAGERTVVWKGKQSKSLSLLKAGDFVYAVIDPDDRGKLIVRELYANIINAYGSVTRVSGKEVFVQIHQPEPTGQVARVVIGNDTVINNGKGSVADIRGGLFVQFVGVVLPGNEIVATRIWVYVDRIMTPH